MRTILGVAALALLTACAGTPSRYYSLAPTVQSTQPAPAAARAADFAFRLLEVRIPGEVDRPHLVVRSDSSTEVTVLNQSLWAAPLADEIRAALAQELARALAAPDVSSMAAPAHLPVWTIAVQVRRFELRTGAWTMLDASWTLAQGPASGAVAHICRALIQRPVAGEGVEPLVDSQRAAVAQLAAAIAESITARRAAPSSKARQDSGCTYS